MIYDIHHRTRYEYEEPVSISHHLSRLTPSVREGQEVLAHELTIYPTPESRSTHEDYFGNQVTFFAMKGLHHVLEVSAFSRIQVKEKSALDRRLDVSWEEIAERVKGSEFNKETEAGEFVYSSPMVKCGEEFADYAKQFFLKNRPIWESAEDLTLAMFRDFKFDPEATDVATPVEVAFKQRRGVCQDFAHVFLSCVRSIGIPARYVSGYLETLPPPGEPKLIGADASHAWVSVWCGEALGWLEFDPTNGCMPGRHHIGIARGRDFFDVSPLRGVVYGYGEQKLRVEVDVNLVSKD